eukprot:SAG31_NODE_1838_length_7128_cov_4.274125_2_plen_214_part_00
MRSRFMDLVAAGANGDQHLRERIDSVAATVAAKDTVAFKFGTQEEFKGGLEGMIGLPQGKNEAEFIKSMEAEHCDVDAKNPNSTDWGGSDREWTTGNYGIQTTPRLEWHFVKDMQWKGRQLRSDGCAPGGRARDEKGEFTEQELHGRTPVSIEQLHKEAPPRILAALQQLQKIRGEASADGNLPTLAEIRKKWLEAKVNIAELLSLRLYTGEE